MRRLVPFALAVAAGLLSALAATALAHSSGCHSAHSCPSDHHTYVWFDSSGQGWDCAEPGAPEYDSALDTTTITYGGYTYYCRAAATSAPPPTTTTTSPTRTHPTETVPPAAEPQRDARCQVRGALPDRTCTPGATFRASARTVCRRGYSKRVRNVPQSLKDRVYAEYGITSHRSGQYEVDHLISLELGGSNSIKNLFPEAAEPRPGFHEKDKLENRLHALVCAGTLTLRMAQRQIATNWLRAYRREFGSR